MNVATIDIGTNTTLLLVAAIDDAGAMTPLAYEQRVPRLGTGVDERRVLRADAIERVIAVLREYRLLIAPHRCDATVVFGTSAVRDAANRDDLARRIAAETGFALEVLSGAEEARWTYRGAVSGLPGLARTTVLDIGGGSTELTTGNGQTIAAQASLDIGSVRLTERFLRHDPPLSTEIDEVERTVEDHLRSAEGVPTEGSTLVGVAGTATSLAVLAQGLRTFTVRAVTNYRMGRDTVEHLRHSLLRMSVAEIRALSTVMEGRADVMAAGAMILGAVMRRFGFEEVIVSERGVRYGVALREWERLKGRRTA